MMDQENIINFRDPQHEKSLSFSCYHFNSSLQVFSHDKEEEEELEDDESYIEIALESSRSHEVQGESDEEIELRMSFSSMLPLPELSGQSLKHNLLPSKSLESLGAETSDQTPTKTETSSSSSSSSSSSATTGTGSSAGGAPKSPSPQKSMRRRSVQPPAVNRLLNMLMSNLRVSSDMSPEKGRPDGNPPLPNRTSNSWDLVRTRKASKVSTAINGGIMKLMIKFKSIKIRSMLSLVKPSKVSSPQGNKRRSEESPQYCERLMKPFDKGAVEREEKKSSIMDNTPGNGEKWRVLEINLDAIKGVVEAMGMSIGRKDKPTAKSCPSSIKSSPIHNGIPTSERKVFTRETSVQGAIAHCKRSFSET